MRKIKAHEFVRRLKQAVGDQDSKYTLFLGAGCSISCGIPGAGALVKRWLPELKILKIGDEYSYEKWIKEEYPDYSEEKAALFYGKIIEELLFHRHFL